MGGPRISGILTYVDGFLGNGSIGNRLKMVFGSIWTDSQPEYSNLSPYWTIFIRLTVSGQVNHSQIGSRPNLDWVVADRDPIRIGSRPNLATADCTRNFHTHENPSKWNNTRLFGLRIRPHRSEDHFQSIADPAISQKSIKMYQNP